MSAPIRTHRSILILALLSFLTLAGCYSSGTVEGTLTFYQNQGNYCPATRDCTGAKYTQAQFATFQPLRNTKVYILRQPGSAVIGQGTTNGAGVFKIKWVTGQSSSDNKDVAARLIVRFEQDDGRFAVHRVTGALWLAAHDFVADHGNHSQKLGTLSLGNAAAPNEVANIFDGAVRMWNNSLGQSNRMNLYFTNLSIRAFEPPPPAPPAANNTCQTSCAIGSFNPDEPDQPGFGPHLVRMDPNNSGFAPQARVMHEMGHIASFVASRDQSYNWGGDYCFPTTAAAVAPLTCAAAGWNIGSPEWGAAMFEEAAATHLADVGLYFPTATQPRTCISTTFCSNAANNNIETSLGTTCGVNVNRQAINSVRYHWDNYDNLDDYTGAASDNLNMGMWHVVDTIHALGNGTGELQKDEPWNGTGTILDDRDGRSNTDFQIAWNNFGTNSATQLSQNCGGSGD